jgi:hypothetical protein
MELDPIEFEKTSEEGVNRERQATQEKGDKAHPLVPVREGVAVSMSLPVYGY